MYALRPLIRLRAPLFGSINRFSSNPLRNSGVRLMSTEDGIGNLDEYEKKIYKILESEFSPKNLEVKDVSGGCGSMFAILVQSEKFKGIPMVKQHRLVNEALKDEISKWHGLQLRTKSA